jgi:molybdenum cofactor sulfurtransferase
MGNNQSLSSNSQNALGMQHAGHRSLFNLLASERAKESVHSLPSAKTQDPPDYSEKSTIDNPRQVAYAPPVSHPTQGDAAVAYQVFLKAFPEYQLTWILDTLRRTDFTRLDHANETYVDYMGGALYPESLIRVHTSFLSGNILGNTHSVSNR